MSFKLEIKGNEKIEKALKSLCEKNKDVLARAGFEVYYTKSNDKYYFHCIETKLQARIGMKLYGKRAITKAIKKQFTKIDPNCEIKEVKI